MWASERRHRRAQWLETALRKPSRGQTRALAAEAHERRRVVDALHDGTQQRLVVLAIGLSQLNEQIDSDPARASRLAGQLERETQDALTELRAVVDGLEPPVLVDFGLVHALHSVSRAFPMSVNFVMKGVDRYESSVEDAVFFTCREALQNTIKHAPEATSIELALIDQRTELEFSIEDDGRGFAAAMPGSGFATMHHRIESLGGSLTIGSSPGIGTRVHGAVPLV